MTNHLLLLHGALGSPSQYDALQTELTEFNTHAIGFTGHMGGMEPPHLGFDLFDKDILRYLDSQKIDRCSVFGFSMGGYAALHFSLTYPDRFDKIVTLGTKFSWGLKESQQEALNLRPEFILEKAPHYAQYLKGLHGNQWSNLMYRTAEMMLDLGTGKAMQMQDLSVIKTPVTITRGTKDRMITAEESQSAAAHLPNGIFRELSDVPHPLERIETPVLAEFIRSELGSPAR